MRRKSLNDRRAEALADLEQAKRRLASIEDTAAARIGRLALKAGLVELELSDTELLNELSIITARLRTRRALNTPPPPPKATGES
jgi:TraC-like protein